ncbi:MAG: hypothetical protein EOO62_07630 [Hymenobacter sp.]|nr:MAG: hypothetical protein EOO62_07630 [Hymenobacter sp.]
MEEAVLRQLCWLKVYAIASTLVGGALLALLFYRTATPRRVEELTVERLNVVEQNGTLRLVLSNQARQHPGIVEGKPLPARPRGAGLLFFNTEGDECGGLLYDGDHRQASLSLSADQYHNDQVMQLQYQEAPASGRRSYGLRLWDRPANFTLGELARRLDSLQRLHDTLRYLDGVASLQARHLLGEERLFLGRNGQRETGLFIHDSLGRPRIQLYINAQGEPQLETISASGVRVRMR